LLSTCKLVYAEALDVFFGVNVVRFWRSIELDSAVKEDQRCLAFVRHLELVNVTNEWHWLRAKAIPTIIDTCKKFPRLKSLTIAFDALSVSTGHQSKPRRTLKKLLAATTINDELQCVDVGVYTLRNSASPKIFFKHFGIVQEWCKVKTQKDVDLVASYAAHANWVLRMLPHTTQTTLTWGIGARLTLPEWCAVFDAWRLTQGSHFQSEEEEMLVVELENIYHRRRTMWGEELQPMPEMGAALMLKDIDAAKHGLELVDWLTDTLIFSNQHHGHINL